MGNQWLKWLEAPFDAEIPADIFYRGADLSDGSNQLNWGNLKPLAPRFELARLVEVDPRLRLIYKWGNLVHHPNY